jgi:hypothetical protein
VLFDWALPACLRFVRRELEELSPSEDAGLARGAMRIIESCLDDFVQGEHSQPPYHLKCVPSNVVTAHAWGRQQLRSASKIQPVWQVLTTVRWRVCRCSTKVSYS